MLFGNFFFRAVQFLEKNEKKNVQLRNHLAKFEHLICFKHIILEVLFKIYHPNLENLRDF